MKLQSERWMSHSTTELSACLAQRASRYSSSASGLRWSSTPSSSGQTRPRTCNVTPFNRGPPALSVAAWLASYIRTSCTSAT